MAGMTAAVCKNGHVASVDVVDPARRLERGRKGAGLVWSPDMGPVGRQGAGPEVDRFCGKCGATVITACESCSAAIPSPDYLGGMDDPAPFCTRCGTPQPWATREQRTGRLVALVDAEENLDSATRLVVVEAIEVLAEPDGDTNSQDERVNAGERFKRLAPKAWTVAAPVLTAVLTSEIRMRLGLPPG